MNLQIYTDKKAGDLNFDEVLSIFSSVDWPHAEFPDKLKVALENSQELVTAFDGEKLIGFVNAVGDAQFYAYIHWLIVHQEYHGQGLARRLVSAMLELLESSNQVFIIADRALIKFWESFGFVILKDEKDSELIAGYRSVPQLKGH